jgi:hypothetical protein
VVIYVEIFILGIREPLANTGQLCSTTSNLWDILYWMFDSHTVGRLLERSFVTLCNRVSSILNICT